MKVLIQASIKADLTAVIRWSGWGWGPLESACLAKGVEPPPREDKWCFHREGRVPECNGILWKGSSWTHAVSAHLNPDACLRWDLRKRLEPAASGGEAEDNIVLLTLCKPLSVSLSMSHLQCSTSTTISASKPLSFCLSFISQLFLTLCRLSLKSHVISRNASVLFEVVKVSSLPLQGWYYFGLWSS